MSSLHTTIQALHALPPQERQVKVMEMFEHHSIKIKGVLLALSCVFGDKASVQAMLKQKPELLNKPQAISAYLPKSYPAWVFHEVLPPLFHALAAKQPSIALYLLKSPTIQVSLESFYISPTGWNTLSIASMFLNDDAKQGKVLKALLDKGERSLSIPLNNSDNMSVFEGSLESLQTRALKVFVTHPSFAWSTIPKDQVERIDGLLANEVDEISRRLEDERLGFYKVSAREKNTSKAWLKTLLASQMPKDQYPTLDKLLKLFPDVQVDYEKGLLEKSINPSSKQSSSSKIRL